MLATTPGFQEAVTARITEIETRTDAEIVVVVAPASLDGRLWAERAGLALGLLTGAALILLPFAFSAWALLLDFALVWAATRWVSLRLRLPWRLTRAAALERAVLARAQIVFLTENVHGTPRRTGCLVFVSHAEERVTLLCDLGVQGAVPAGELVGATDAFHHHDLDHFLAGLDALGAALARHLPHQADSDSTNLPNTPKVLT